MAQKLGRQLALDPEEGKERPQDGSKARPAPLMAQAVWSGSELRGKGLWRAGAGLWPGRGPEPHQGTFLSEEQGLSDKSPVGDAPNVRSSKGQRYTVDFC